MTSPSLDASLDLLPAWRAYLDKPLSGLSCLIGWITATSVYVALTVILGGPIEGDAAESVYSTWAVAHGKLSCAYPPFSSLSFPHIARPSTLVAPLYPLVSGLLAAVLRIGQALPFPSADQLGPNCSSAFIAMYQWSARSSAILPTIRLSYLTWPVLMIGAIAVLRTSGRGRCRWEPVALILLAAAPPVFMPILDSFHPQDLLAMGLILGGLAGAFSERWLLAGVLMGLAFTSQQFAILAFVPVFVAMPARHRNRFASSALVAVAIVDVPMILFTSGRALTATLLGSSRLKLFGSEHLVSSGGTLLFSLDLHGWSLFIVARVIPVIVTMALAWWVTRKLGPAALEPVVLLSLVGLSFCMRLVFEENLFGYYFMALAVALIVLDVLRGHLRGSVIAWVALVTLAFNPIPWGFYSNWTPWGKDLHRALPFVFVGLVLAVVVLSALRGRIRWYLVGWLVLVTLTCFPELWGKPLGSHFVPTWFWQMMLVPTAFALLLGPVKAAMRQGRDLRSTATELHVDH
jgi:hypothetical protein